MRRVVLAAVLGAIGLRADTAGDAADVFRKAAEALRNRKAAALWLLFDSSMPGYKRVRAESGALLELASADSTIDVLQNEGDERARTVELDWSMEIVQRERVASITRRRATVKCRVELRDGAWRIVSLEPADFFAPTRAAEAWDSLAGAVDALNRPLDNSPTNPAQFLSLFDANMAGYERLREGITGLLRRGAVETSVDLAANEGDDRVRTLEVDWTLQVSDENTLIAILRRQQRVKLRMEWDGKRWRVTSVDPIEFFE